MSDQSLTVLIDSWRQCERHMHHLQHALNSIAKDLPLTPESVERLDDEAVQDWDQFILRFTKLQDVMGARLYPAVLAYLQEPLEDRPMLDKLNRLEKLGYLTSVEQWLMLRAIRNRFAHDYPQDQAMQAAYLNEALDAVPILQGLMSRIAPLIPG